MLIVVSLVTNYSYSQANVFEGEIKFIQATDEFLDTVTYLVKDEKIYIFKPKSVSDFTGGYSRESLEVTDTSIIDIAFNPTTGDSIKVEIDARDNHGVPTPLSDTIVDGFLLSGNVFTVNVQGFLPGDSLSIRTKIYYIKDGYRFHDGQSNYMNSVFNTPRFEIPYCVIKATRPKLAKAYVGGENELILHSAKRKPVDMTSIHERWYSL